MSRFDKLLQGEPKIRYVRLKQPDVKYDLATNSGEFSVALMAKVVDYQNQVICDAIVKYATEQGYTNLCLIDENFIKSAIIREIERIKDNEQRETDY